MALLQTVYEFLLNSFEFLINRPLILLGLMALPFLFAWFFKRCFPTQRMLVWMLLPVSLSLFIAFVPQLKIVVIIFDLIFIAIPTIDLLTVVSAKHFTAKRSMIPIASLGKSHDCELTIENRSHRTCRVRIKDDLPQNFEQSPAHFEYHFQPRARTSFNYDFMCTERGKFDMECVHLTVNSLLGMWQSYVNVPLQSSFSVYPDMKQISEYELLARTNRLALLGVRRSRRIGQDNEFERLRDYTQDDNYRHIDWRTTARRRKLTVRDFQSNQSQRIIFMLDCGRMMTGESASGVSMLDHSLNAMLMLSYIALKQGDSAGLICFSDTIHNYTPPKSGVQHVNRLLHATFDQQPRFVESRYDKAFLYLRSHCMKRSLVVLVTNVIDEINSHQIHQYLGSLVTRHLPLGVFLRDHQMFDPVETYDGRPDQTYEAAAASKIISWRHKVITDMQHQGIMSLDVYPEKLTAQLVNQYLEIKAKHLL